MKIIFLSDGLSMAFDENGEQVSEAQKPWLLVYIEHLVSQGIDPTKQIIALPDGRQATILKSEDEDGEVIYNWTISAPTNLSTEELARHYAEVLLLPEYDDFLDILAGEQYSKAGAARVGEKQFTQLVNVAIRQILNERIA
jgi:hypothetical protein